MPVATLQLYSVEPIDYAAVSNRVANQLTDTVDMSRTQAVSLNWVSDTDALKLELPGADMAYCEHAVSAIARDLALTDIVLRPTHCDCAENTITNLEFTE